MEKPGLVLRFVLDKGCRRVRYVPAAGVAAVSVHVVRVVWNVDS